MGFINRRELDSNTDNYGIFAHLCKYVPATFMDVGEQIRIGDYMNIGVLKSYGSGFNNMLKNNYL